MSPHRDRSPVAASVLKRGVLQTLLPAVYPALCPGCRAETGQPMTLCPACWDGMSFIDGAGCPICGRPLPGLGPGEEAICDDCAELPRGWSLGRSAFLYEATGRRLILSLKHGDRLDLVPLLARWTARAGAPLLDHADIVVPVPLHWTRRLVRRANQSAELGRAVARLARVPFEPDALVRARRTRSQKGHDRDQRYANLAGAFAVNRARRPALVGARIVLIDDVMTTGATLHMAATALLDGGAARVDCLVAALAGRASSSYLSGQSNREESPEEP